ncbi:hypothetical protein KPH14_004081 [Odynerus spinipes]|uniref:MICAL-like protein 1 n=1 Tax=Odynerus spinipes TaxID=1348599 RepID=A0AAD9RZE8_9HYME|nr:hypothetical protein KPH14_004081 [Odynerus spinipes]
MRRDPCAACGLPVFLAEKLVIGHAAYHRTCFRCARCGHQLMPDNYYETEEGQYCCETCPDEERTFLSSSSLLLATGRRPREQRKYNDEGAEEASEEQEEEEEEDEEVEDREEDEDLEEGVSVEIKGKEEKEEMPMTDNRVSGYGHRRSLSDEEKTKRKMVLELKDNEEVVVLGRKRSVDAQIPDLISQTSRMRLDFMASQLYSEKSGEDSPIEERIIRKSTFSGTEDVADNDNADAAAVDNDEGEKEEKERCSPSKDESTSLVDPPKPSTTEAKNSKEEAASLPLSQEIHSNRSPTQSREDATLTAQNDSNKLQVPSPPVRTNRRNHVPKDEQLSRSLVEEEIDSRKERKEPVEQRATFDSVDESLADVSLSTAQGIDLSTSEEYPEELNPFKSDEEELEEHEGDKDTEGEYQTALDGSRNTSKISTNPFDDSADDDEDKKEEKEVPLSPLKTTVLPAKRRLTAPQISLNPFSSDEEDESDTESKPIVLPGTVPVPKPRTITNISELGLIQKTSDLNRRGVYASNSSITSTESFSTPSGTYKKKKPAPLPPTAKELFPSTGYRSVSPRTTPRTRKAKPAPPPPIITSTPNASVGTPLTLEESPINKTDEIAENRVNNMWEDQKNNKDEANRNRQSLTSISCSESPSFKSYPDKSVQGKWKRKKGPAPPRPIPHRRKIKVMSMKDVKLELDEIELQQQGLERQGVRLEQLIRDKCETGARVDESSLSLDVEELILELFALVNEKNELFRRQAELMLLRRQQRLEEEHADVEYQIRCLMCQPEATKTDFDKQREEALIQRLVEIVERRNEIVECLEMDRKRAVEEDKSIHKHMGLFAARNKDATNSNNESSNSMKSKKIKIKEKIKEKKFKKLAKKDADKDVDETEVKLKRHNKRKWF